MENFLYYFGLIFLIFGTFFTFSAIVGLIRNKDLFIKLHSVSLLNLYGLNFILFSLALTTKETGIFFEILLIIIINSISTLTLINSFFRNALLNDCKFNAKSRMQIIKEKNKNIKEMLNEEEKFEKQKKSSTGKISPKIKIEFSEKEEELSEQELREKDELEEEEKIRKENEELRQKIKEQKRILRKKIETARKNAFITRKQSEIDKTENLIKEILTKYNLTEESLQEDNED